MHKYSKSFCLCIQNYCVTNIIYNLFTSVLLISVMLYLSCIYTATKTYPQRGAKIVFGKGRIQENQFIIAVKDLEATEKALQTEKISLPFEKSLYRDLLATSKNKADKMKDLSKFIKSQKKSKGEVKHYWENLITEGYTLMSVIYDKKAPSIEKICSTDKFILVCRV